MSLSRGGWHVAGPLPIISDLAVSGVTEASFTVSFTTDVGTLAWLEYGPTGFDTATPRSGVARGHSITVDGLEPGTYHVRVTAQGRSGSARATLDVLLQTGGGPTITSGPTVLGITETGATVEWSLNEPATGQVFYGTTPGGPYPLSTTRESTLNWSAHIQPITGLAAATTYYGYVESTNGIGGTTTSDEFSWTTLDSEVEAPTTVYGPGIGLTSLSNTTLQGTRQGANRFRAEKSGTVTHVRWYVKVDNSGGYSAGSNYVYEMQIRPDNGSGFPSNTVLGTTGNVSLGSSQNAGFNMAFTTQPTLVAGQLYHWVLINRHSSPSSNYVSCNAMYDFHGEAGLESPWFPRYPLNDHIFMYGTPGSWTLRPAHAPIFDLTYSDGSHQGQGYMERSSSTTPSSQARANASLGQMFRERFTVAGGSRTITGAGIHVRRSSATTAALVVALRDGSGARGNVIDSFNIAAGSVQTAERWVGGLFASPQALANGSTYRLEFSTTGNGDYLSWGIRRGTQYGYHASVCFEGGIGEYSTNDGSSWATLLNQSGAGNQMDVQCYMALQ